METTPQELIEKLKRNPKMLEQLLHSPDGMRLMQMMNGRDGGSSLKNAASAAGHGNTEPMAKLVQGVMNSAEGAAIAERIRKMLDN